MINVKELSDGKLEIEWDQNDPLESILNDWTEKDFQDFFAHCLSQDSGEFRKESGETGISEADEKDWEDFWYNSESEGKDFKQYFFAPENYGTWNPQEDDITKEN